MLSWAVSFLLIALVAAFFGWGGIASASTGMAQILFFVFIVLFLVSALTGTFRRRHPKP
jgi:uncharacterized membrane protein YtjA (UPF0391 family)